MDGFQASFIIHDIPVGLVCGHEETFERIRRHLGAYEAPGWVPGSVGIAVVISYESVFYPVPLHSKRVLRYGRVRNYYLDEVSYFTDYFSTLTISADGRSLRGNLSPEADREQGVQFFVDLLFNLALFEALRFHGLYYLHAAALVDPEGRSYLISGNSGSGKTSLTLALVESGFKFVSDDTVFMRLQGDRDVEILGFARDIHVPADLISERDYLSVLESCPDYQVAGVKKRLAPSEHFQDRRVSGTVNPGVLIFPEISSDGTGLESLTMAEAMTHLLPQSLSVTFHPRLARDHLEALKRVVRHARAFRLRAGRELKGDPARVREVVAEARDLRGRLS